MKYTCVDSFSGAGGLALGLSEAQYDLLLSFDSDPLCIKTQKMNSKWVKHDAELAQIEDMLGGRLLKKTGLALGELFLLAGGPPCQGFSIQRIGEDHDVRNYLVNLFVDLISEVLPQWFLMENVPGIAGKRGKQILEASLSRAAALGYWIHRSTLDAQDFGIAQRRRRVFVIGERNDHGLPQFTFPNPTTPVGSRVLVRDVIGHLPEPPENGSDHPEHPHHRRDRLSLLNKKRILAVGPGQGRQYLPEELLSGCHRLSPDKIGHRNVYGRMHWDSVAPTITARFDSFSRGLFGHPEQTRTISLREGALLQTFPEDFVFAGSKVDIARQIGNAVPPRLASVLGSQIIRCHKENNVPDLKALEQVVR